VKRSRPLPGYELPVVDRGDRELAERTEGRIQFPRAIGHGPPP
jgi:hypothetical protein